MATPRTDQMLEPVYERLSKCSPMAVEMCLEVFKADPRIPKDAKQIITDLAVLGMKAMVEYSSLREELAGMEIMLEEDDEEDNDVER